MMSVIIKGMKMPSSCASCEWSMLSKMDLGMSCYCSIAKKTEGIDIARKGRMSFCPLVEVPTPHGDLIDKDKLNVHNYWYDKPKNGKTHFAFVYNGDIKKAEVVIGAEDGT